MLVSHLILHLGKCLMLSLYSHFSLILGTLPLGKCLMLSLYSHFSLILGTHAGLSSHFTSW